MSSYPVIIQQDDKIEHQFHEQDFDLSYWQSKAESETLSGGRGASQKITINNQQFVLRRYLRGGLMARLLHDLYLWTGLSHTRPWQEREVIQHALKHQLPVPEVSAFYLQRNLIFYRAAIISRFISNQGTLACFLFDRDMTDQKWFELGRLIKKMHQAGIYHADLNANNILTGENLEFYLIDFDKAKIITVTGKTAQKNLQRLLRSLNKIQRQRREKNLSFNFSRENWQQLLSGYK